MVYGCVKTFGRWDNFLTKDNAKEGIMLPQTGNPIFMFKMIHYNGKLWVWFNLRVK